MSCSEETRVGTTIIIASCEDYIVIVSDGRAITESAKGRDISEGCFIKLQTVGGKYLAARAGNAGMASVMLNLFEKKLDENVARQTIVKLINGYYQQAQLDLDKNKTAAVNIVGLEKERSFISILGEQFTLPLLVTNSGPKFSIIGSGAIFAKDYLSKIVEPPISINETIESLKKCVAFASLNDPSTGGSFHIGWLKRDGSLFVENIRPHLFEVIAQNFEEFNENEFFSRCFVVLTEGFEPEPSAERRIGEYLKSRFRGMLSITIIGVEKGSQKTIRIASFETNLHRNAALTRVAKARAPKDEKPMKMWFEPLTKKLFVELESEFKDKFLGGW